MNLQIGIKMWPPAVKTTFAVLCLIYNYIYIYEAKLYYTSECLASLGPPRVTGEPRSQGEQW